MKNLETTTTPYELARGKAQFVPTMTAAIAQGTALVEHPGREMQ
jgi:hypothetical protein